MTRFFHLYFSGGRYDALHGLPLADLPALAKLEDLVRSVARDLFFDGNDRRQRVSAGFDEAFQPRITQIEGGGSADCEVAWSPVPDDENSQYYEAAQTEILDLLYNVANDVHEFPPWWSQRSARLLADCLDLLQDDETVAISAATLEPVTVGTTQREIVRHEANSSSARLRTGGRRISSLPRPIGRSPAGRSTWHVRAGTSVTGERPSIRA